MDFDGFLMDFDWILMDLICWTREHIHFPQQKRGFHAPLVVGMGHVTNGTSEFFCRIQKKLNFLRARPCGLFLAPILRRVKLPVFFGQQHGPIFRVGSIFFSPVLCCLLSVAFGDMTNRRWSFFIGLGAILSSPDRSGTIACWWNFSCQETYSPLALDVRKPTGWGFNPHKKKL